uniref:Uncharacterized protein n=1 Tax=Anguilla anguilla TaxID=7936 RepID=A0A0E9PIJ2_ANGAN
MHHMLSYLRSILVQSRMFRMQSYTLVNLMNLYSWPYL